jgi:hypothetical protein
METFDECLLEACYILFTRSCIFNEIYKFLFPYIEEEINIE